MQQIQIIGNIGQDAQIQVSNGNEFVRFTVAVNRKFKKQDGSEVEETNWYNITTQNEKLATYLKKGTMVFVQGNLSTSIYRAASGKNRVSLDIRAEKIQLLNSPKKED